MRGRGLGGSSAVNGSVYVRGLPDDFDAWRDLGCEGWGWRDIEPCFQAIEQKTGGRLRVTSHPSPTRLCDAVIDAASALGISEADDLNTLNGPGIGYQPRTIFRGRRQSASVAFLAEAKKRPNLRILLMTDVRRIVFEGTRAVGVEVLGRSGETSVLRGRETVLCAGAVNTPKILLLSGIGPAGDLRELGIGIMVDSPEVGGNLREHRLLSLQFSILHGSDNAKFSGSGLLASLLRYYAFRSGPLAQAAFEVGGFVKTDPSASRPDAQIEAVEEPANTSRTIAADPVLLFRYSALTFNGHRIHYDQPYVTQEEHYPNLIFHGPLQATLLLSLAAEELGGRPPPNFTFRSVHPLYAGGPAQLNMRKEASELALWITDSVGTVTMRARANSF